MIRIEHCMVVSLLLASTAASTGQQIPRAISKDSDWASTIESRRTHAGEWLREMALIESQIPTLSPAEQVWLRDEYDSELARNGATPRAMRARFSREGSSRFAKPVASRMVAILEELSSISPSAAGREVALWSELAYLCLEANFWGDIAALGDLGIIARDPQSKAGTGGLPGYQELLRGIWAARAQSILQRIILPFVERSTGR